MSSFISSYAISSALRQAVLNAQSNLAQARQEVSTGTYADVGVALGAQTAQDISLRSQESLLQTLTTTNNLTATNLSTTQGVLSSFQTTAQSLLNSLVGSGNQDGVATSLQQQAQSALQALISGLNTTEGGNYIFAGTNTAVAPITDYYGTGAANKSAVDFGLFIVFRLFADELQRRQYNPQPDAELSRYAIRALVPGHELDVELVHGLQHDDKQRDFAVADCLDVGQRE